MAEWTPSPQSVWTMLGPVPGPDIYRGADRGFAGMNPGVVQDPNAPWNQSGLPPIAIPPTEAVASGPRYSPDQLAAMELAAGLGPNPSGHSGTGPQTLDLGPAGGYPGALPMPPGVTTPDYNQVRNLMAQGAPQSLPPPDYQPYPGYDQSQWGDDKLVGMLQGLAQGALQPSQSTGDFLLHLAAGVGQGYAGAYGERRAQEREGQLQDWQGQQQHDMQVWQEQQAQGERERAYLMDQANLEQQIASGTAEAENKTQANNYQYQLAQYQQQVDSWDRSQPKYLGTENGYGIYQVTADGKQQLVYQPLDAFWAAKDAAAVHGLDSSMAINAIAQSGDPNAPKKLIGAMMFGILPVPEATAIVRNTQRDAARISQMAQVTWAKQHGQVIDPEATSQLGPADNFMPATITTKEDAEAWQKLLVEEAANYFTMFPDRYGAMLSLLGGDAGSEAP